ncbi:MAG: tRNA uridine-5-carboxymethylaminomethyl(34) synthesis GTPase MnmE [Prevotella sp.]|uniref:tRNA uridine-5-carboxymethylaminomethyl(34) synthesis GTPase MnmE n=1 Tax=Prevotella sp. TaxID=59823 RepID=UPI0025E1FB4C|nr:tRNA uridine-5-carboxymethylaminomethyl(34) synthesis GTPase MnmE [Prevotella sp.]MCI7119706.1 tRNA uridine-5-carboxymethylaminomethyl(34) synthesis GTPase MnmE [Prevotella sp.]
MLNNNTICAIATAPGGAIGIIRISGSEAISIADRIFRPVCSTLSLSERKAYTLAFGNIVNANNDVIDEVLVSIFRAPHSYTGEDSVEISCHGSAYVLQQVMLLLTENGCVPAGPGEFTQRAFLNGKMDLSQAEAVADLISSTNKATHDMAMSQLKGHFSNELADLRAHLLKLTSLLELELDFSDHEELEFADRSELYTLANDIHQRLVSLARSFEVGNALKNGIPVAIVGNTNVGKSTLLNHLLHEEKAIVSDVHGTTRDFIEDSTIINGIQFRFVDTAGIRDTDDIVENIGIERTYKKMQEAKIVLWLIDEEPDASKIEDIKQCVAGKKLIIVRNKIDLTNSSLNDSSSAKPTIQHSKLNIQNSQSVDISAKYGTNLPLLEQLIVETANIPQISESDIVITSVRHYSALLKADESLQRVIQSMNIGLSGDLLAEDLRMVIEHLAEITGEEKITPQETLNSIFSSYCIGK